MRRRLTAPVLLTLILAAAPAIVRGAGGGDPRALTPVMRDWARRHGSEQGTPEQRARHLLAALIARQGLGLREIARPTLTAIEVFERRRANCVGLAHLLVALGRDLDLPLYFVVTTDFAAHDVRDGLRLTEGHLAAAIGPLDHPTVLDFGGAVRIDPSRLRVITDATAVAIFFSNRGAEALLAAAGEPAVPWLRRAVELDPGLGRAWANLGVAERRAGNVRAAEAAYLRALEVEPELAAARQNLAVLRLGLGQGAGVRLASASGSGAFE